MDMIYLQDPEIEILTHDLMFHASDYLKTLILTPSATDAFNIEIYLQKQSFKQMPQVFSLDKFCETLLQRYPQFKNHRLLKDRECREIISALSAQVFKNSTELRNFCSSHSFLTYLYKLFCNLNNNDIEAQGFIDSIQSSAMNPIDKNRLLSIGNVYCQYNHILKAHHFFDHSHLIHQAIALLDEDPFLLIDFASRYRTIYLFGFQDFSILERRFVCTLFKTQNIMLYGNEKMRLQTSQTPLKNSLDEMILQQMFQRKVVRSDNIHRFRNQDIRIGAELLLSQLKEGISPKNSAFSPIDPIVSMPFTDLLEEGEFIARMIRQVVHDHGISYKDIAIFIRNKAKKEQLTSLLRSLNIPIHDDSVTEAFAKFKQVVVNYLTLFSQIGTWTELADYLDHLPEEELSDFPLSRLSLPVLYECFQQESYVFFLLTVIESGFAQEFDMAFVKETGLLIQEIKTYITLYRDVLEIPFPLTVLIRLLQEYTLHSLSEDNFGVRITSFSHSLTCHFKILFLACLTDQEHPVPFRIAQFISHESTQALLSQIQKKSPGFHMVIEDEENSFHEDLRLFCLAMTRATDKLILTTHQYDERNIVQPSIYFTFLDSLQKGRQEDFFVNSGTVPSSMTNTSLKLFSPCIEEFTPESVLAKDDILHLSPSMIRAFQNCPRQYYYRYLVKIKGKSLFEADYGIIVHRILEVFNKNFQDAYTRSNLKTVATLLFDSVNNSVTALRLGFTELDIDLLQATNRIKREVIQQKFFGAIEELDRIGFFSNTQVDIQTEKEFSFTLTDEQPVVISGRIDAILKSGDCYTLIDYKTGKDKSKLDYLLSDYGMAFQGSFGRYKGLYNKQHETNYDYQMPLYYMACTQEHQYTGRIQSVEYLYVRPKQYHGGTKIDSIASERIETYQDRLVENLMKTVIKPLQETQKFCRTEDKSICAYCSYQYLCNRS